MFKGSIPALITPMREDGSLDLAAWDRLLDFHLDQRSDAVVVGGTTGESPTVAADELATLIGRAKTRVAGRMPVIAGSGGNSTTRSVALSRAAVEAGADALLVVTPYYNRPTQEEEILRTKTPYGLAPRDVAGRFLDPDDPPMRRESCDGLGQKIARRTRRHVIEDHGRARRVRDSREMPVKALLRRPVVVRRHDQQRIGARLDRRTRQCNAAGRRVAAAARNHRHAARDARLCAADQCRELVSSDGR